MSKRDKRKTSWDEEGGTSEGKSAVEELFRLGYDFPDNTHTGDVQNALIKREDGTWALGDVILMRVGIELPEEMGLEQYCALGEKLLGVSGSLVWWVGDWLNYGKDRKWGDSIRELMEKLDVEADTLYHYAWLANKVKIWIRNPDLSPSHHRLIAKFEDESVQRQWLEWAAAGDGGKPVSLSQMRQAIRDWEMLHSPTLLMGKQENAQNTLITREKRRDFGKFLKLASKAGQGDTKARRLALGWITEHRQWLDEVEKLLKG